MSDKKNDNYSDDFDLDFSKKSESRNSKQNMPINPPEDIHIPIRSGSTNRRPGTKRKKYKPPKDTILIYVIIAVVIMIIVTVVFIISFNNTKNNDNGTTDGESSSVTAYLISNDTHKTSEESSESEDSDSKPEPIVVPADYGYDYFENDLFIGDSIFTGLNYYGFLSTHNVAAEIGFTPYGAHYNTLSDYEGTAVDYAGSIQPDHINIMLGSNMLNPDVSYTDMIDSYKSLIKALEEATPNSKICIISVPPVTMNSSAAEGVGMTNNIIDTANGYIKDMCEELKVKYFDLNGYLSDEEGYFKEKYAEGDGLHFKAETYDVLLYGLEQMWKKEIL